MMLKEIQAEHKEWVNRNFGENRPAWHSLLGLVEEVGELAHSYLKREQNIRGTKAEHDAKIKDAVGDIVIYLIDFCNKEGLNLPCVIKDVWDHVKTRDWTSERKSISLENKMIMLCEMIKSRHFRFTNEKYLQDGLELLFSDKNIEYWRELSLDKGRGNIGRIDFVIQNVGIEVKIDGTNSQLLRQIHKYLTTDTIDGLIVVTNLARLADLPAVINGKPVKVVHLIQL